METVVHLLGNDHYVSSFLFQLIGFLAFRKSFDWVKANFDLMISDIQHKTNILAAYRYTIRMLLPGICM